MTVAVTDCSIAINDHRLAHGASDSRDLLRLSTVAGDHLSGLIPATPTIPPRIARVMV